MSSTDLTVTIKDVPVFLAGFLYEMTGTNHLLEIEACYEGGEIMPIEIEAGIKDLKHGGWDSDAQAVLQFALVLLQVPEALHTCKNMHEDIAAIKEWASIFTNTSALVAKVTARVALHRK